MCEEATCHGYYEISIISLGIGPGPGGSTSSPGLLLGPRAQRGHVARSGSQLQHSFARWLWVRSPGRPTGQHSVAGVVWTVSETALGSFYAGLEQTRPTGARDHSPSSGKRARGGESVTWPRGRTGRGLARGSAGERAAEGAAWAGPPGESAGGAGRGGSGDGGGGGGSGGGAGSPGELMGSAWGSWGGWR